MSAKRVKMLGVGADIGVTVALQVLGSAVAFLFQMLVLRALSKDDSGIYFLVNSYVTIASGLGDFGLAAVITPRLSVARGEATPAFKVAVHIRIAALLVSWILLNLYLVIIGQGQLLLLTNAAYLWVLLSSRATGLRQLYEILWRLRGRTYVITAITMIDATIGLVGLYLVYRFGHVTTLEALFISSVCNLPGFIVVMIPIISRLRASGVMRVRIPRRFYTGMVMASLPVGLMGFLGQVSGQLETLVIGMSRTMTTSDISAFNAATKPLIATLFIAVAVSYGVVPIIAQSTKGVRNDHSFAFIVSLTLRILGVIGMGGAVVAMLFAREIMSIFGPQFIGDAYILKMYSLVSALVYLVVMFDQFLLAIGQRKQTLYGAMLYLGIALVTELFAVRSWGISGLIFAKTFATFCMLAFQASRFSPEIRIAILKATARLLPSIGVMAAALLLTGEMELIPRSLIVILSTLGAVLLSRAVTVAELVTLKSMRIR
ncbi:MAG: polysaccharide biosynthesis C-terminal domain-containing protein [Bacteroidota bacterium]